MAVPTTTMRLDEKTKKEAKQILDKLGLNLSSATNLYLKAIVRNNGIPFDLQLAKPETNFIDEYIAPLMSDRNKINRANTITTRIKKELLAYNKAINTERKKVTSW